MFLLLFFFRRYFLVIFIELSLGDKLFHKVQLFFYFILLYCHIINMNIYTYTCRIHIDAIIKTSEDFFKKNIPLTLLKGLCVRGSWRLNKNCNILTSPAPPDIAVCRSRLLDCSTGGLGPLSAGCCSLYRILSLTHLISNFLCRVILLFYVHSIYSLG